MFNGLLLVSVVVVVLVVVVSLAVRKGLGEKCATYLRELHDSEAFIKALVGGQYHYDRLKFIFPETLEELIREYSKMRAKYQQEGFEHNLRSSQLYRDFVDKSRQVPEADGTPETELQRKVAQEIKSRAYEVYKAERCQWGYLGDNRTTVDDLVHRARNKELARVIQQGVKVFVTEVVGVSSRFIFRLSDGRYFLIGFRAGHGCDLNVGGISYCTDSPGQFSERELEAVVADKGRLEAAKCGVFDG